MVWNPVANYFALVTAAGAGLAPGVVLLGRDSFHEIREDRDLWIKLTSGGSFAIVWGLDGRPVTRGEAGQLLNPREGTRMVGKLQKTMVGDKEVEVMVEVAEPVTFPPLHPRQIRPEATGAPTMPRRHYEPLPAEPACKPCAARTRNLLLAEISPIAQGEACAPPKPPDPPRVRLPNHSPPPPAGARDPRAAPPPAVHAVAGPVRGPDAGPVPDAPAPLSQ